MLTLPKSTVLWTTFAYGVKNGEPNCDNIKGASIF